MMPAQGLGLGWTLETSTVTSWGWAATVTGFLPLLIHSRFALKRATLLASIRQMSGQVSRGSAGEYQADERAGVEWLSWRVSGRATSAVRDQSHDQCMISHVIGV